MKTGVIKRTSLPTSARFDASYHLSEGETVKRTINNSPYKLISVGDAAERIFYGARARRVYVSKKDHGVPFLSSSDILLSDLSNVKYVSKKHTPSIDDMKLQKGWVLISRSGTVGNCAYTNEKYAQRLASEDIIRLVPNNILRGGFVYAYLASKYGYSLLTQGTFGAVIQHIEPNNVAGIPIPVFPDDFQAKVDDLIQESSRLREEAADLLEKAKNMVEEIFPEFEVSKIGKVNSKEVFTSINKRIDATFHNSVGKCYNDYIKKTFQFKTLVEMATITRPGLFKRNYVKKGIMFLGGADIFLAIPHSNKFLSKAKTPDISSLEIKEGTILMPRSGTIGDVAIATSQHAQRLASEHVIRLTPNNILNSGFLYAFLSSKIGKCLIQRYIFGSVIQHVEPHLLNEIPIPIFADDVTKQISDYALKNKDNLGKAAELELSAISLVEKAIESWAK